MDSIDSAIDYDNIDWIPEILQENIKIILTISSSNVVDLKQTEVFDKSESGDLLLAKLIKRDNVEFTNLTAFSQEQWNDVLSFGGVDVYAANGALQLPETWKNAEEKIPIQAKVNC